MMRFSVLFLTASVLSGCLFEFECEDTVVSESSQPGGRHRAVVFVRDCGATTLWSTQVSVLGQEELSDRHGGKVFAAEGGTPEEPGVTVRWLTRGQLEVAYAPHLRVFHQETTVKGVEVSFVEHGA